MFGLTNHRIKELSPTWHDALDVTRLFRMGCGGGRGLLHAPPLRPGGGDTQLFWCVCATRVSKTRERIFLENEGTKILKICILRAEILTKTRLGMIFSPLTMENRLGSADWSLKGGSWPRYIPVPLSNVSAPGLYAQVQTIQCITSKKRCDVSEFWLLGRMCQQRVCKRVFVCVCVGGGGCVCVCVCVLMYFLLFKTIKNYKTMIKITTITGKSKKYNKAASYNIKLTCARQISIQKWG